MLLHFEEKITKTNILLLETTRTNESTSEMHIHNLPLFFQCGKIQDSQLQPGWFGAKKTGFWEGNAPCNRLTTIWFV